MLLWYVREDGYRKVRIAASNYFLSNPSGKPVRLPSCTYRLGLRDLVLAMLRAAICSVRGELPCLGH